MAYGIAHIKQNYATLLADIPKNTPENSICLELNSWPPESADVHDYAGRIEIRINNADQKKVGKEQDGETKADKNNADEKRVGKEKNGEKEEFFLSALLLEKQKPVQKITCRVKLHKNSELEVLDWKTGWEKVAERL